MQRVWETTFCGRPCIVKQRFRKRYRHPQLDAKLTSSRLKQEARSLLRARKAGIPAPALYFVEPEAGCLYMERVQGRSLRHLLQAGALDSPAVARVAAEVGRLLALLHDGGLVHGDLTTSNMLVREVRAGRAPWAASACLAPVAVAAAWLRMRALPSPGTRLLSFAQDRAAPRSTPMTFLLPTPLQNHHARTQRATVRRRRRADRLWTVVQLQAARGQGRRPVRARARAHVGALAPGRTVRRHHGGVQEALAAVVGDVQPVCRR